jgi:hypothetical protein
MQFSAEIWRRSEYIQALGDFSKLIGEKSPIQRQRAKYTIEICRQNLGRKSILPPPLQEKYPPRTGATLMFNVILDL